MKGLRNKYGLDIVPEFLSQEVAKEIDKQIIKSIFRSSLIEETKSNIKRTIREERLRKLLDNNNYY